MSKRMTFRGSSVRRSRRRHKGRIAAGAAALGCGLALAAAVGLSVFHFGDAGEGQEQIAEIQTENLETDGIRETTIEGISIEGMTREEAKAAILEHYPWELQVSCGSETVSTDNLLAVMADRMLDEIEQDGGGGDRFFDFTEIKDEISAVSAEMAARWDTGAKDGTLDHFDKESGTFVFTDGTSGLSLNQEKLTEDILAALERKEFDAVIQMDIREIMPKTAEEVRDMYKTVSTFTTTTTSNENRNTNVRLSAQALDGTIVKPGEEFSFNEVVGMRTEEKGYRSAAAYNSGEVVQEIGGGVCQISSTLYRVVFQAGMEITFRRSHTFEPSYVTPGQDAAISWGQPDFRFVNTSDYAIGIRAGYSNQKATVSLYGVPVLEEGISWDLASEKKGDTAIPEPTYIEDPSLAPGTETVQKAGSAGSTWVTYKVVYRDGVEIERIKDHEKTYKGHAPVIRRNTASAETVETVPETPGTSEPETVVDGMPEGYVPGEGIINSEPETELIGPGAE